MIDKDTQQRLQELAESLGLDVKDIRIEGNPIKQLSIKMQRFMVDAILDGRKHHVPAVIVMSTVQATLDELYDDISREHPDEFKHFEMVRAAMGQARKGNVSNLKLLIDEIQQLERKMYGG